MNLFTGFFFYQKTFQVQTTVVITFFTMFFPHWYNYFSSQKKEKFHALLRISSKLSIFFFCLIFLLFFFIISISSSLVIEAYKNRFHIHTRGKKLVCVCMAYKNLSKFCKLRLWFIMKIYYPKKKMNIVIRYTNFLYMTTTMYKESNILIMQKIKKIEQQQQDKKK